ncbi:YraN family protein [Telmatospirillum sp. J64-1]|uniref:YraN family protein n=1 Tax=Telmatospirillum sp. J64-1 TaxID=2502183 RepID=UPI00115F2B70|nr:YraN family protein [Telmatospirillum sp. J64-1]
MTGEAQRRGRRAETLAVWLLRLKGWRILARGHRTGRGTGAGEVDIVARRGRVLAFVEVKARADRAAAAEAVSPRQRARILRAAEAFLAAHPHLATLTPRFDVILVTPAALPCHLIDAWRP